MCGSRENQRAGFEGIGNACLPSSLSSLPTPASPCHALLDGAAKWASDVPSGEVGTGGMGRAVVVVAVDASTIITTGKRVTLFFFLFVLCSCLKEPPVPSLPDPWCLTPSAPSDPTLPHGHTGPYWKLLVMCLKAPPPNLCPNPHLPPLPLSLLTAIMT